MTTQVFQSFTLPNGLTVKNRLVKAAMEENMATADNLPSAELFKLYQAWAQGGVGLIITGNVMVDRLAMTGPGGVALQQNTDLAPFKTWASIAKQNDTKVLMQINHPGRQVFANMNGKVLAPSAIQVDLGKYSKMFGEPKAMTEAEINEVIERFVTTAKLAEQAGFDGVEVHAAHGYLVSQFLSPRTNQRQDKWGGSLENRARLLLAIVKRIKQTCATDFTVAVKLNSADFQRGGFSVEDAQQVVAWLEPFAIDFVELSGGNYESPALQGHTSDDSTLAREAYFLNFAEQIAKTTQLPIMTTGGIKRFAVAEQVVASGVELVGMATALAFTPDLANIWQQNPYYIAPIKAIDWQNKTMKSMAIMANVKRQLQRLGAGKSPKLNANPVFTLFKDQWRKAKLTKRYRKTLGV